MKRRGFLGLLGGAVAAGPSMAKQAASAAITDMNLPGIAINGVGSMGMSGMAVASSSVTDDWALRMVRLAARTNAEHQERQCQQYINGIDPDLVAYRSFALHAKISIQRKRDYWRGVENEKSWLQRRIDGIMDW